MTIEEYVEKYKDADPLSLGKNIFTLEPIPEYEKVKQNSYRPKKLSEEQKKDIGERLNNARNRK